MRYTEGQAAALLLGISFEDAVDNVISKLTPDDEHSINEAFRKELAQMEAAEVYPEYHKDIALVHHLHEYGRTHGQTAQMTAMLRLIDFLHQRFTEGG